MAENERINLSPAEWGLMEYLWEHSPSTGREAAEYCARRNGWSRTTTLTVLRHLVDKGAVRCDGSGTRNSYEPLLRRDDAAMHETQGFLRRVYKGSVGLMLTAMTKKQELTKEEIAELREILRKAEGGDGDA